MQGIEKSAIKDKRAANAVARLGQLEVSLMETPWYRFKARKALQDQINHLVWTVFLWSVSFNRADLETDSKEQTIIAPQGAADAE
nr:hypothetical protein [Ferrimicrobium acidiphilum]